MNAVALLLSDDLLDTSRIVGSARDQGVTIKWARHLGGLAALARQEAPALVLVDLATPRLSVGDLLAVLGQVCPAMPRVVAYGAHVDAAGLRAARQTGCDVVLPRSAFFADLPQQLSGWLNRPAPET
jgi:DNA-binding NarL/FixJ family response regulator